MQFSVSLFRSKTLLLACLALVPTALSAAVVPLDETGLDAIYAQPVFGDTPIDIRINETVELFAPELRVIETEEALIALASFANPSGPAIDIAFVDTLDFCEGVYAPGFAGCAFIDAAGVILETAIAAGPFGTELAAHEIGHNLGLEHEDGLLSVFLDGDTTITPEQAETIFASPLLQSDADGLFLELNPILITGDLPAIPLPAGGLFLLTGLGALWMARRRSQLSDN